MRERVKTVILMVLVVVSIALTGRLLFGQPALETAAMPAFEQPVFGEIRPVALQTLPKIRLGKEEGQWHLLFPWHSNHAQAWELLLELLRGSGTAQPQDEGPVMADMTVVAEFFVPASLDSWVATSRVAELTLTTIAWDATDPDRLWYQDVESNWLTGLLPAVLPEWESEIQSVFATATPYLTTEPDSWGTLHVLPEDPVLLPLDLPVLAPFSAKTEELDTEKLLRSIFVDIALVRRIEERDGAFIYTDGQRGLRLFEHGELEYTSPNSEPGSKPLEHLQVLRRTAQYLQLMGGWSDHLYIGQLEEAPLLSWDRRQWGSYAISMFSVQHDVPLVSPQPAVSLRFSDRGVIHYNRQVILLDRPSGIEATLIDPRDVADVVADQLEREHGDATLASVSSAYYLEGVAGQAVAQPVWIFSFSEEIKAVVHGHSGRFLTWLE